MAPSSRKTPWLAVLALTICTMLVLFIGILLLLPGPFSLFGLEGGYPLFALVHGSSDPGASAASATPFQPLPTSTPTATNTPTNTPTATPTNTPTPTATHTPEPTSTPEPTNPPLPTEIAPADYPPPDDLSPSAEIEGVYGYAQSYSLSCESRTAVDWARFYGVDIGEMEFQSALPLSDNPDEGFVGYIDDFTGRIPPESYGVHAEPVAAVLQDFGVGATALRGYDFDELRRQVAAGNPVIVWVIGNVWYGVPVAYTASDGREVTVAHFEHTAIVTGYDAWGVTLVDNNMVYWRSNSAFLSSWEVLGNMAIIAE